MKKIFSKVVTHSTDDTVSSSSAVCPDTPEGHFRDSSASWSLWEVKAWKKGGCECPEVCALQGREVGSEKRLGSASSFRAFPSRCRDPAQTTPRKSGSSATQITWIISCLDKPFLPPFFLFSLFYHLILISHLHTLLSSFLFPLSFLSPLSPFAVHPLPLFLFPLPRARETPHPLISNLAMRRWRRRNPVGGSFLERRLVGVAGFFPFRSSRRGFPPAEGSPAPKDAVGGSAGRPSGEGAAPPPWGSPLSHRSRGTRAASLGAFVPLWRSKKSAEAIKRNVFVPKPNYIDRRHAESHGAAFLQQATFCPIPGPLVIELTEGPIIISMIHLAKHLNYAGAGSHGGMFTLPPPFLPSPSALTISPPLPMVAPPLSLTLVSLLPLPPPLLPLPLAGSLRYVRRS
ncbi:hypothetical protein C7M84_019018 [Penaeus vannamei]|uniref:Uncharacterized protein n=1 Tax=Penaeus vannamei TaxID=6689 RepID=A0A423SFV9_PENVA|nr:hypothetical protein C7M84_019018 [Penaeus vannamei]